MLGSDKDTKENERKNYLGTQIDRIFAGRREEMVERWFKATSQECDSDLRDTKLIGMYAEAVMCYTYGLCLSTIFTCGTTAERMCMDLLLRHRLDIDGKELTSEEKGPLLNVSYRQMVDLLHGWKMIDDDTRDSLHRLYDIRNEYIHPDTTPTVIEPASIEKLFDNAYNSIKMLNHIMCGMFPS